MTSSACSSDHTRIPCAQRRVCSWQSEMSEVPKFNFSANQERSSESLIQDIEAILPLFQGKVLCFKSVVVSFVEEFAGNLTQFSKIKYLNHMI